MLFSVCIPEYAFTDITDFISQLGRAVTYIDVDSMDVVRLLSLENHPPAVSCKSVIDDYRNWYTHFMFANYVMYKPGRKQSPLFLSGYSRALLHFTSLGLGDTCSRIWESIGVVHA